MNGAARGSVRRRDLMLLAATAGAGLLTGCTAGGSREPWSDLGVEPMPRHGLGPMRLEDPAEGTRESVVTPGRSYQLDGVRLTAALTPDEVNQFSHQIPGPEEEVRAPSGRVFLLVTLVTEDTIWPLAAGTAPEDTFRILRAGRGEDRDAFTPSSRPDGVTYLLQVPEDPAPEDAVLEVTTQGTVQTLSLIDGSRLSSEIEHAYTMPTAVSLRTAQDSADPLSGSVSLTAQVPPSDEEGEDRAADDPVDVLEVSVGSGTIAPFSAEHGWADGEEVFLGLSLGVTQVHRRGGRSVGFPLDAPTLVLELPDGERRDPLAPPSGALVPPAPGPAGGTRVEARFPVPVGVRSARLLITVSPYEQREGLSEDLGADEPFEVEVQLGS